jgi:hypothetical protein
MKRYLKVLRAASLIVLAYLASANAWENYRGADYLGPVTLLNATFRHLAWLGSVTHFMWIPGWITVYAIGQDGAGTPSTDLLIPILSSVYWGGMGIFILKSVDQLRHSGSWANLSKIQRFEFVVAIAFVVLSAGCFVCELFPNGKYQSEGMILTVWVYGLSLLSLALALLVALFLLPNRLIRWWKAMRPPPVNSC